MITEKSRQARMVAPLLIAQSVLALIAWGAAASAGSGLSASTGFSTVQIAGESSQSLAVREPWARATAPMMKNGAAYLTIVNNGKSGDRLLSAASTAASRVELHKTEFDDKGVMRMREARAIEIPAGESVKIAPGGYHLMLVGLRDPLKEGESFTIRLRFEKAGERVVTVRVRGIRAKPGGGHGSGHGGH